MKKETQTIIYIVYFNFKLFLFESLDDSKDSDAVDNI